MTRSAAEATAQRVRAAALELFVRQGYEHASLREIADRVGITKASLYYHYRSKQALLEAVVLPLITEWRAIVDETASLPHTPANVRLVLSRVLDMMLRHRGASGIFVRDAAAVFTALQPIWEDLIQLGTRLNAWLAGPSPSDADRVRAMAAVEALGVAMRSGALLPGVSEDELRRTLLDCAASVLGLRRRGPATG